MKIRKSELILNPDGSVYHLNLKPEHIADTIIFVGDQDRVEKITSHFNRIEFKTQKREFKTQTGYYKDKRISVLSTGIGPDNIDIVMNELDALVNIDLERRSPKTELRSLNIIRIGTSGAIQDDIPTGAFLMSSYALDLCGMLHFYQTESFSHPEIENAFMKHSQWSTSKARPLFINNSNRLEKKLESSEVYKGVTATAPGFYAPQGRVLRLPLQDPDLNRHIKSFHHKNLKITNYEMETAAIYGLSKLLGHHALSMSAIIANRSKANVSDKPDKVIEDLIAYTLDRI